MRGKPIIVALSLLAIVPLLAACDDFDADKLDIFHLNDKKKLPGERKPLFPEGVPGTAQGIPPELVKGYQPPAAAEVAPEPEKPKPRVVRRAPKPTPIVVNPATRPPAATAPAAPPPQQAQQQQQQPAWPDPKPQPAGAPASAQNPWPAAQPQQQTSPWPAAPPPNTFQR